MGIINSATTAASTASNVISGIGTGIGAVSSVISGVSKIISSVGEGHTEVPNVTLPFPNPLHAYATYDYILSIGILTPDQINNPDTTYMAGKGFSIICKSANAEPANRVETAYGRFDFFIDNLVLESSLGHEKNCNTNVTRLTFDIYEPYSMGLFGVTCQKAAADAGWKNWREGSFIMRIDFRGNTETGQMNAIPGTSRYIPFRFITLDMTVTAEGGKYACTATPYNQEALTTKVANLKSDASISGKTVQEALQTGEKSLQSVINKRLQQLKTDKIVEVPDEVLILFPTDISSAASAGGGPSSGASTFNGATVSSGSGTSHVIDSTNGGLLSKLGVSRSKVNDTLVQADGQCNDLGKASLGFSNGRRADPPFGKENNIWDPKSQVWVRINNSFDTTVSDSRFRQDTDIMNAINQILLQSDFPDKTFEPARLTPEGYRQWWKIDVMTYVIATDKNMSTTGVTPKLYVYRVIPYLVHVSSGPLPPNTKPPGYAKLYYQAVKHYNYIYTGKNADVLDFTINFKNTFAVLMSADAAKHSSDVKSSAQTSSTVEKKVNTISLKGGEANSDTTPTQTTYSGTSIPSDKLGGGGNESASTRAARLFHDAINNSDLDMYKLEMTIMGDPYFVAQSGLGNYTAKPTQYVNLNVDGTANHQSGEVDVIVNFRTPIDLKQSTGMYDFAGQSKSTPVMQFSGFYKVWRVDSSFKSGKFTQRLFGNRRILQESDARDAMPNQLFSNASFSALDANGEIMDLGKKVATFAGEVKEVVQDAVNTIGSAVGLVDNVAGNIVNTANIASSTANYLNGAVSQSNIAVDSANTNSVTKK